MGVTSLFKTTTTEAAPFDGSTPTATAAGATSVSDFLTVQSLTNFSAMTGAITAAWHALMRANSTMFSSLWVPYAFAAVFGLVSIVISTEGLKKSSGKFDAGKIITAVFIATINALVLASAVVGTAVTTRSTP